MIQLEDPKGRLDFGELAAAFRVPLGILTIKVKTTTLSTSKYKEMLAATKIDAQNICQVIKKTMPIMCGGSLDS